MSSSSETITTDNPLLERGKLPPFDRIQPDHVIPAVRSVLADLETRFARLESASDLAGREVLNELVEIDYEIHRTWGPVGHLLGVKNSDELRNAYETVQSEVVDFGLRMGQSRRVFEALTEIQDSPQFAELSPARRRIVELRLKDARHSGVGLEGADRDRFNEIARELSKLYTEFSNHVLDSTKAFAMDLSDSGDVDGLPDSIKAAAAQSYNQAHPDAKAAATPEAGPWRVTLDLPSYLPYMQHARNRGLREKLYRTYITRASSGELDNQPLITKILAHRKEQAALLGFESWAEYSLDAKMAESVDEVTRLSEELLVASIEPARQELRELQELAGERGQTEDLMAWDVPYWAERLREERFQFTDEELRAYFPMPRVLDGLFDLVRGLFGIHVRAADGEAPVWHSDVRYFVIEDAESGEALASFYLDPYSRPADKRGGAWMGDCIGRRKIEKKAEHDGAIELPVAYLVCNGSPPVGDRPSLLSFREVETLFHEFGHGLQHMLTRVEEADVAGINGVEWDAVELPSQFMENWCYHKPTLLGMTAHVETGATMPDDLFERVRSARTFRAAWQMLRQLNFGLIDMELHHSFDPAGEESVFDVQSRIEERTSLIPRLEEDRFLCSFTHIFAGGYSAGYYSYKWAEVLSADAFSAFEEALEAAGTDGTTAGADGLPEAVAKIGRRFRDTVLAQGGSRHPMEVFVDFRGRRPTTAALLRHSGLAQAG
ncbi:MAG: M3 family metallopeptidase [bacterium]|nr:M3 family metallopeptidase [bacterium]